MVSKDQCLTLSISSGKGGVGKTSLTVNLAFALIQRGERVLIVDGDLGLANVDVLLGISAKKTIQDMIERNGDPMESIVYPEPNLGVLPASSGVPHMVALGPDEQEQIGATLAGFFPAFSYVLIDTAAGIGSSVLWFNTFAQYNMVLLNADPTSLTDVYALVKILSHEYGRKRFHVILSSVSSEKEARQTYETLANAANRFLALDLDFFGAIPKDEAVQKAVRRQVPFVQGAPKSAAALAVHAIAKKVQALKKWDGPLS
jgi:flagellar biosynthesis protein FlhG